MKNEFDEVASESAIAADQSSLSGAVWQDMIADALASAANLNSSACTSGEQSLARDSQHSGSELPFLNLKDAAKAQESVRESEEQDLSGNAKDKENSAQPEYTKGALIGPENLKLDQAGINATIKFLFDQESQQEDKILALQKLTANEQWQASSSAKQTYGIREEKAQEDTIYTLFARDENEKILLQGRVDKHGQVLILQSDAGSKEQGQNSKSKGEKELSTNKSSNVHDNDLVDLGEPNKRDTKRSSLESALSLHGGKDINSSIGSDRPTNETTSKQDLSSSIESSGAISSESNQAEQKKELNKELKKRRKRLSEQELDLKLAKQFELDQRRDAQEKEIEQNKKSKKADSSEKRLREVRPEKRRETERPGEKARVADWSKNLKDQAKQNLGADQINQFLDELESFEAKAANGELSKIEVQNTMKQLSKILSAKVSAVNEADRILAVRTFARHLAMPDTCNQGHHNTCNVTTLTTRNLRRNPSKMAEMLKSAILSGSWVAPDGKKIKLSPFSLIPGGEEAFPFELPAERSYATQVLNNVLINDISQRRVPPEFYVQEKPQSIDDSGEALRYADNSPVNKEAPAIRVEEMDEAQSRLTGESKFVIYNALFKTDCKNLLPVSSEDELAKCLAKLKAEASLPAILYVDTRHREFGGDDTAGNGTPRAHVVSITDYDQARGSAMVLNQWGPDWNRRYTLQELYKSTLPINE